MNKAFYEQVKKIMALEVSANKKIEQIKLLIGLVEEMGNMGEQPEPIHRVPITPLTVAPPEIHDEPILKNPVNTLTPPVAGSDINKTDISDILAMRQKTVEVTSKRRKQ